ncbi:MAG: phosphate propanoyltransferase [Oscillospiraceae bacterium]|nr:phosphate propanoyltransferase [Oscillospiraceae bacterium]
MVSQQTVRYITELIIDTARELEENPFAVPVGISARHVHLSREAIDILFGRGYELTVFKGLSQPGQYAANETVGVVGPKGSFKKVRVLGPARPQSQIEISQSDTRTLGISAPLRESGDLNGTPGVKLVGPAGEVELKGGLIIAKRHVHMSPADAAWFGVKDKDIVMVRADGEKGGIFTDVVVRVNENYSLDMHIDTDEANAFGIKPGQKLTLIKNGFNFKEGLR